MVQAGVRWGATMGIAPDPFRFRTTPLLQPARADDRSYASDAHARPAGGCRVTAGIRVARNVRSPLGRRAPRG